MGELGDRRYAQIKKELLEYYKETDDSLSYSKLFEFDIDNLTKDERELLILEADCYRDRMLESQRKWKEKNPDYHTDYYHKNQQKMNEYSNNYKNAHPEIYINKNVCTVCGGSFVIYRKRVHISSKKHINALKNIKIVEESRFVE